MATCCMSQSQDCQDGDEVLKCQGLTRHFRKPKYTKERIKEDSNRYFVENFWKFLTYAKFKL